MTTQKTTIKLAQETKQRLEKLREHPRETFDDILRKTLWILNTTKTDPEKAKTSLTKIEELRKRWIKPRKKIIEKDKEENVKAIKVKGEEK